MSFLHSCRRSLLVTAAGGGRYRRAHIDVDKAVTPTISRAHVLGRVGGGASGLGGSPRRRRTHGEGPPPPGDLRVRTLTEEEKVVGPPGVAWNQSFDMCQAMLSGSSRKRQSETCRSCI